MAYSVAWIKRQKAKGADILVAGKIPQECYEQAELLRRHGYEPVSRGVLKQTQPTPYPYYQWWRVAQEAISWSARREGLVPMKERNPAS